MLRRPRYADVVATLALVLAVGGTAAYAADALPKNSVGKQQLKKDAVTSNKIKNGKVKGKDLKAGTLVTSNLANDAVTSVKIANGGVALGDLAAGSVNGSKVVDKTLSLDDLAGSTGTTTIALEGLAPGACLPVVIVVPGSVGSQFAMIGQVGGSTTAPVSLTPARPGAGQVTSSLCNVGNAAFGAGSVVLKAVTLG